MEYGLIPKINQYTDNKALEVQKVQPSKIATEIINKDELKQIQQEAFKSKETKIFKQKWKPKFFALINMRLYNKYEFWF